MSSELRNRLIFGPLFAGIFIGTIALDMATQSEIAVLCLMTILSAAACLEFAQLVRPHAPGVQRISMSALSALLMLIPWLSTSSFWPTELLAEDLPYRGMLLGIGFVWIGLRQFQRYTTENFLHNIGATTLGLCYLGLLPSMLIGMLLLGDDSNPNQGHLLLLLLVATVKMGDIAAFAGGKNFGKYKMAPKISPGKTWEGFAFALAGAIGGAYLFLYLATLCGATNPFSGWWQPLVWGAVLGPIGVFGDLWESGIKRDLAVKDSSKIIPGFGGILDILDAILIAGPVAFFLALLLI
jgi:phosphatidate cytidylyltransferase